MAPIAGSQKLSLFHAVLHYSSDKQHLKYRNLEDEIERYGIGCYRSKKPTVNLQIGEREETPTKESRQFINLVH